MSENEGSGQRWSDRIRAELGPMGTLAWPVVLAELGWMAMGIVDTLMVAPLGPAAIGAVGLGHGVFFVPGVFGMGLLLGLDTLVSQAYGAGKLEDCRRSLFQGVWLAIFLSLPLAGLIWMGTPALPALGIGVEVFEPTARYIQVVTWSMPTLLLYTALRRYLQGINVVRPVMIALVSANLINVATNWLLIEGRLGFPALGVAGAAWATVISRLYMTAVLALAVWLHDPREIVAELTNRAVRPDWSRIRRLAALGLPAALHLALEVGVFASAAALAGTLGPVDLASHQIALNVCALAFMVPLGVSSAGAVRVGQAIGRGDPRGASTSGWTALGLGVGFMTLSATAFLIAPRSIITLFTTDPDVVRTGVTLLFVAAAFQLFDGLQVVAAGNLRGAGDTHTPMYTGLVAYWAIGLPVGYALAFWADLRVVGLWMGLSLGLIVAGLVLVTAWSSRSRSIPVGNARLAPANC